MSSPVAWARLNYKTLLLALFCFACFIVFEASQQLFYAHNFNNGEPSSVTFIQVLVGGAYRWLIWSVLAVPVVWYVWKRPVRELTVLNISRYGLFVMVVLLCNLLLITLNNLWQYGDMTENFGTLLKFYFFHKAPIIFVALTFLIILVHYFKKQEELQLSIRELGSLKYSNQQLYEQLKAETIRDEAMVIQVKVGNRVKLVPLETIVWVEADDYCVRIHDDQARAYTLRSTMKALEERLPSQQFVRVHRKALVNLSEVKEYVFGGKPMVVLNDGTEVPLAQSRVKELRSLLQGAGS